MRNKVEIAVILFSNEGREINFRDINNGKCYLESYEMSPDFFWGATGGFEIIADGYNKIFREFEFYVALQAIDFLLHSLYWLKEIPKKIDVDEEFPDSVVSRFQSSNFIKLSRCKNDIIEFSYNPNTSRKIVSGNKFFNGELFLERDFEHALMIGLSEYFNTLEKVIHGNPTNNKTHVLENYLSDWHAINKI